MDKYPPIIHVYEYWNYRDGGGKDYRRCNFHPNIDQGLLVFDEIKYHSDGSKSDHYIYIHASDFWKAAQTMADTFGYDLIIRPRSEGDNGH